MRVKGKIAEMLKGQKRHISFHTPGHKRAGADITELSYSDNLLSPTGVIAEAERDIADILGAHKSFLLTDGSTAGIFAMVYALRAAGIQKLAVPSGSHRSVFNACRVLNVDMVPVKQVVSRGIPLQPSEEEIAAVLENADALLLTSPDYYGFLAPLKRAKELCRAAGKPLVVDGAHGSHLHFCDCHAGRFADMWVDGAHKSLPALTQGAAVSAANEEWAARLFEGVRTFRTTSPSYPVMASVEYAFRYPRKIEIERAAQAAKQKVGAIENDDWTKLVVPFGDRAGEAQAFLEAHGIYPEFNDGNYLMFYLSPCTKKGEIKKLVKMLDTVPRGELGDGVGVIPIYSEDA